MQQEKTLRQADKSKSLRVISRGDIFLLLALLSLVAGFLVWAFLGTVRETVTSNGIIFGSKGILQVTATRDLLITEIKAEKNSFVRKGDILLKVRPLQESDDTIFGGDIMPSESSNILAQIDGYISMINVSEYDVAEAFSLLMEITKCDSPTDLNVITLSTNDSINQLKPGMEARMEIKGLDPSKYGYLTGKISRISYTPQDTFSLTQVLGETGVGAVEGLFEDGGRYLVLIEPDKDEYGNFLMSSGGTLPAQLHINEACDVTFLTEKMHPVDIAFGT